MQTEILAPDPDGLRRAITHLRAGQLVAMPTETVYGLAGDARDDRAVARIFQAKGRPQFNPLIVHVHDLDHAARIAHFTPQALALAERFWPGPLTLVLPWRQTAGLSRLVTAQLPTVAIRVPAHPVAQALLAGFGGPLAAPSANPSGRISPTTAQHVADGLGGKIAAILDGGACPVGLESTIISFSGGDPCLLRHGGVTQEAIEVALARPIAGPAGGAAITAPGMLASHYAPHAPLRLNALTPAAGEVMIGFGPVPGDLTLSPSGDLAQAAAALFAVLRAADAMAVLRAPQTPQMAGADLGGQGGIAIAPIPDHGLGRAINDRLRRAAAPRPAS